MKKVIFGFVIGVMTSVVLSGYATGVWNKIDVLENDVTIVANGTKVSAPNFTYNDSTYVPLRAVLELINCHVSYDEESKEVEVSNKFNFFDNDESSVSYSPGINNLENFNVDDKNLFKIYPNSGNIPEIVEQTIGKDEQKIYMLIAQRLNGEISIIPNKYFGENVNYKQYSGYRPAPRIGWPEEKEKLNEWKVQTKKDIKKTNNTSSKSASPLEAAIDSYSQNIAIEKIDNEYEMEQVELKNRYENW